MVAGTSRARTSVAVDDPEALFETELAGLLAQLRPADPADVLPPEAARH